MISKKKQKLFNSLRRAFTLIEVIVAIFIFVIILSLIIVNYGYSKKVDELRLTVFDLEDSIRFTQNMALTGQKINNQIPTNGYGIFLKKDTYKIYGDNGASGDVTYSSYDLAANIIVEKFVCEVADEEDVESDFFDIKFTAPRGYMEINEKNYFKLCYVIVKNSSMDGFWKINIIPGSTKIWTEFFNN